MSANSYDLKSLAQDTGKIRQLITDASPVIDLVWHITLVANPEPSPMTTGLCLDED